MISIFNSTLESAGEEPPSVELESVHLKPGELFICREPFEVVTVLGSCVAVTIFCARLKLSAICHGMLPSPGEPRLCQPVQPDSFRYLNSVIPVMAAAFEQAGARAGELEVKMFGGANVLGRDPEDARPGVGLANLRMASQLLRQAGLRINAYNVGGCCGRKIVFNTLTGEVLHKHLPSSRPREDLS